MKKTITLGLMSLLVISQVFAADEGPTPNQLAIEAKKAEINELLKNIQKSYEEANENFTAAKNDAEGLKKEFEYKSTVLANALKVANKGTRFGKDVLKKGADLQKKSNEEGKAFKFTDALATISEALKLVAPGPVISLNINPRTISNDFKQMTFDIDFFSTSKATITNWSIHIYMVNSDGKNKANDIKIKSMVGTNAPPTQLVWDGKVDNDFLLAAASDYYIEVEATDSNKETGNSGKVEFKTDIFTRVSEGHGMVIDVSAIQFKLDKYDIEKEYEFVLQRIYDFLIKYPEYKIVVEGHSDFDGMASYNKSLSDKRADSVKNKLVEMGLSANRISSVGMGESAPKTLELSKTELNRRVVFVLIKDEEAEKKYTDYKAAVKFDQEIDSKMVKTTETKKIEDRK